MRRLSHSTPTELPLSYRGTLCLTLSTFSLVAHSHSALSFSIYTSRRKEAGRLFSTDHYWFLVSNSVLPHVPHSAEFGAAIPNFFIQAPTWFHMSRRKRRLPLTWGDITTLYIYSPKSNRANISLKIYIDIYSLSTNDQPLKSKLMKFNPEQQQEQLPSNPPSNNASIDESKRIEDSHVTEVFIADLYLPCDSIAGPCKEGMIIAFGTISEEWWEMNCADIYIYIYRDRGRERDRDREWERGRVTDHNPCSTIIALSVVRNKGKSKIKSPITISNDRIAFL